MDRRTLVSIVCTALLASASFAQEGTAAPKGAPPKEAVQEPPAEEPEAPPGAPAGIEDAMADYLQATKMQETFIPIRGQFFSTPGAQTLGAYTLSLFASERVEFDSNIYLSPDDEESDIILSATVGGRLSRETAVIALDLKFALVGELYTGNSEENNVGGWFDLGAQYGLDKGFVRVFERLLSKDDAVTTTSTTAGGPIVVTATDRYSQTINDAGLSIGSSGEKMGIEASYFWTIWNYGDPLDAMDAVEHRGTLLVRWKGTEKLEWNVQGEALRHEYDEDVTNSYATVAFYVGGHWTPSPKVTLDGRAGYLTQNSDDDALSQDDEEYGGGAGMLTLVWEAQPLFFVEGLVQHDILPAYGSNYQEVDYLRASARWEFRPRWTARGLASYQNSWNSSDGTDGQYLTVEGAVTWRFAEQWEATFMMYWQDFSSEDKVADYTDIRAALQLSFVF